MNNVRLTNNPKTLKRWVGKTTKKVDVVDARQARLVQASLNQKPNLKDGDEMPPLRHWCYFNDETINDGLGKDGHPKRGGFMPPIKLQRRMWAASEVTFDKPIILGKKIIRNSVISDVQMKDGKNGKLCFVTVTHKYKNGSELLVTDKHTIVYREEKKSNSASIKKIAPPKSPTKTKMIRLDAITLFRYSALTFNNHRIHYDLKYCREVEGYPGLVVHGPLIATLLVDFAKNINKNKRIRKFAFKAVSPIFDTDSFKIASKNVSESEAVVWAESKNNLAMIADVTFY